MTPAPAHFHLRVLRLEDIPRVDAIRRLAGWNQTADDWRRLLSLSPAGCFVAEKEGVVVGCVTTTAYGRALGWIGMMLVHPEQRRQGIGRALLERAIRYLAQCGVGCIGLDATPAGKPLYVHAGFTPVWELARWRGEIPQLSIAQNRALQPTISTGLWPALPALDKRTIGVDRPALLAALAKQSSRVAALPDDAGALSAFGMIRAGSLGHMLGPLLAPDPATAEKLLASLCASLPPVPVFWDIPEANAPAVGLAASLGFTRQRTLTRMARGTAYPPHETGPLFAIADLAAG